MNNIKKLLIAGGDMRQIYCAARLDREYDISVIGIDEEHFPKGMTPNFAHPSMLAEFDCAVLPVLPPDEAGNIPAPLYSGTLTVDDVDRLLKKDALIVTGLDSPHIGSLFPEKKHLAYMEREELAIKNAIPTAEGAIQLALEELPVTLNGLSVLIVGLGRIGSSLALILKGFGADVTAAVRNSKGAAKAKLLGIKSVDTKTVDGRYKLVFNTVPRLIFTKAVMSRFPEDTLFIDLASLPGGFDMKAAEALGRKVIFAPGLPGKTAPETAGKAAAETMIELIERGGAYD